MGGLQLPKPQGYQEQIDPVDEQIDDDLNHLDEQILAQNKPAEESDCKSKNRDVARDRCKVEIERNRTGFTELPIH